MQRAQRSCIVHTAQTKGKDRGTQARHSLGEQSVTAVPTQPVESCPTGRPRAPTRLPARNRQVGHTHSFPANAQLGPETDFTENK